MSSPRGVIHERVIAKAMRRLVPFPLLMHALAFLDRANLGFASRRRASHP